MNRKTPGNKKIQTSKPVKKLGKKTEVQSSAVRLNKFIADAGVCSRRNADELIEQSRVKVNGKVANKLGTVIEKNSSVTVDGNPVKEKLNLIYILLNKPKDCITTSKDEKGRKTVLDIVKKRDRIYPVGRLDRNTTGALLLTNDGDLAHRLTHPSFQVERTYNVLLDKPMNPADASKISKGGIEIDDYSTSPCDILIFPDKKEKVMLTFTEGRNHEIKKIFENFGYKVKQLDRKVFANLNTNGLQKGEYRHLIRKEVLSLRKQVGLKND